MDCLTGAYNVAKSNLRNCYETYGVVAGKTHFNYYWARDSFYASWGALEIGDYKIVKKNLELFLKNVSENGQVPLRIGASNLSQTIAFIGLKGENNLKPYYNQDKGLNPAIDPNLLLIITLEKYVSKTKDYELIKKNLEKIHKIHDWLETFEKDGLICAGRYATWQDMIKKEGFVLYTNVLYYQAILSLNKTLNYIGVRNCFLEKALIVKAKINEKFYDKKLGYYVDFYNDKKISKVFSSDGNFFAILFDVANKTQSNAILNKAKKFGISKTVPSFTNHPKHDKSEVYHPFYLIGMQDYNDYGVAWTWIGCLHVMALIKVEKTREAKELLEKLSKLIVQDKAAYEVYEKNGKPLNRTFYKSEKEFAWSAGFYIVAKNMLKNEN